MAIGLLSRAAASTNTSRSNAPKADNAAGSSRPEVAEQMEVQACDCAMPNYQGRAFARKGVLLGVEKAAVCACEHL